jgi:hypothetical protein
MADAKALELLHRVPHPARSRRTIHRVDEAGAGHVAPLRHLAPRECLQQSRFTHARIAEEHRDLAPGDVLDCRKRRLEVLGDEREIKLLL